MAYSAFKVHRLDVAVRDDVHAEAYGGDDAPVGVAPENLRGGL